MNVTISDDAAKKLRGLLDKEGGDAVVRLREAKVGAGWKAVLMLMLSIDEREDGDIESETGSVPFVINEELADQYGQSYAVTLGENDMPEVKALGC